MQREEEEGEGRMAREEEGKGREGYTLWVVGEQNTQK